MIKRFFDILFSLLALIFSLPLIIAISLLIFIFDGRPIFFIQERSGLNKKSFNFFKFRTMKNIELLKFDQSSESERITPLGRFLRTSSLDELPSFFNVLKGEMSLVGPRPLLVKYVERYDNFQIKRLDVKPGITGLAQVMGRNSLSWEQRFKLDIQYVKNHNFLMDLKIIMSTLTVVLKRSGISAQTSEIMKEFKGNKK